MASSVSFAQNLGDLPNPIEAKGKGKPQTNVAKANKLVVADPGIGIEIKFDCDPSIASQLNNIALTILIGKKSDGTNITYKHEQEISLFYEDNEHHLDISQPYIFVASFVDNTLWTQEPGEFYVNVVAEYYHSPGPGLNRVPLETLEMAEPVTVPKYNGKFRIKIDGEVPSFTEFPPSIIHPGPNDVQYSNGIFHELGATFDMNSPMQFPPR